MPSPRAQWLCLHGAHGVKVSQACAHTELWSQPKEIDLCPLLVISKVKQCDFSDILPALCLGSTTRSELSYPLMSGKWWNSSGWGTGLPCSQSITLTAGLCCSVTGIGPGSVLWDWQGQEKGKREGKNASERSSSYLRKRWCYCPRLIP